MMTLKIGDAVRVKDGFVDDELGCEMGGWQGRVTELYPDADSALISFDSITIRAIPDDYIRLSLEQGYGWEQYVFGTSDLEVVEPRGAMIAARKAYEEVSKKFQFALIGEEGRGIDEILSEVDDPDDEIQTLDAWWEYIEANVTFPFEAEVSEHQERGPLQGGDKVKVHGIEDSDEHYGILVHLRRGRNKFHFPLCDLAVVDQSSPNHDPVQLYAVWFANR